MVSLLKKSKWLHSEQVLPKLPEESLSEGEENSTESVVSYMYSDNSESSCVEKTSVIDFSFTNEEHSLGRTSQLSCIKSAPNLRTSLQTYKIKSATRIQKFFRLKKLNSRLKGFFARSKDINSRQLMRKGLRGFRSWVDLNHRCSRLIQRRWRLYRNRHKGGAVSPTRRLLVRAVTIGTKLLRIRRFIDKVVVSRGPSPPTSPDPVSNLSLDLFYRSQSSVISMQPSVCSDDPDTQETYTSTPGATVSSKFGCSSIEFAPEQLKYSFSLLMKKPFQIRTKRKRVLKLEELEGQLMLDQRSFMPWMSCSLGAGETKIPCLGESCRYFDRVSSDTKEGLLCEYKELLKS